MKRPEPGCLYHKGVKYMLSFAILVPIIWLAAVILLIVLEAVTYQLVAIWFALGAAAALIASLLDLSGTVQIVVFIVVSALSLIASRPLAKKIQRAPKQKTNADRIIGQKARVIQPILPDQKGRVTVDGQDWSAAAQQPQQSFQVGEEVQVVRIEGVTLYVTR